MRVGRDRLHSSAFIEQRAAKANRGLLALVDAARLSSYVVGVRTRQPVEVAVLQRRVRDVTAARQVQLWTTTAAAAASPGIRIDTDHVVPVIVLVERILEGAYVEEVFAQAVLCRLLHTEHRTAGSEFGLEVSFRIVQRELYLRMLACPIGELAGLGWERYRAGGLLPCEQVV